MIVSWNWLQQYVDLQMSPDELVHRLTMSGLNHEGTETVESDLAIDLEVTSNRPDCLGHLGVAREVAVLYDLPLTVPQPSPGTSGQRIVDLCQVRIDCPDRCHRYTARLIRNAKVTTSPAWLIDRLATIGVASINNVVDATNYVMFECGQPLHAFDFAKVTEGQIVVREPVPREKIEAIDHRTYDLQPGMCVIADGQQPIAIGGVMGGAESEISESTSDILIEAAHFDPLSIRNTARSLNLHSPSSFRFERTIDGQQIDWASRRCCEIILETGGGELLDGVIDVGQQPSVAEPTVLRFSQLNRILGIEIPEEFVPKTLTALGMHVQKQDSVSVISVPPSWRRDLTREIDLVEEVGRIYGYEHVPDDARVPMAASHHTHSDRVVNKVQHILTGAGFDEAMTASLVPAPWSEAFSPWSKAPPLISSQGMLGVLEKASQNIGAVEFARRSLIPSLLEARRINEYRSNPQIELFEGAKVYWPADENELPRQPTLIALTSGRSFFELKGIVHSLVEAIAAGTKLRLVDFDHPLLDINESGEWKIGDQTFGFLGSVSSAGLSQFGFRHPTTVAEFDLGVLENIAVLIPRHHNQSLFPAISRDFNLIMADEVRWSDIEQTVRDAGGELLESVDYMETFRNTEKDGKGKKRILLSVTLRSPEETLTGEQADQVCQSIVGRCSQQHGATLLG